MNAPYTPADVPAVAYAEYATFSTTAIGLFGAVDSRVPISAVRTISTNASDVRAEFARLGAAWRRATGGMSFGLQRQRHPTFGALVALGDALIPALQQELRQGNFVWLEILDAIAGGRGPQLSSGAASSPRAIADAWIAWDPKKPQ